MNISSNIYTYLKDREPGLRYASFDYCYNYFRSFHESSRIGDISSEQNIQVSCLQLAFYLASWGMIRGSAWLLQKSYKHFERLIYEISRMESDLWVVDVNCYTDNNIAKLLDAWGRIRRVLGDDGDNPASDILITKIMLGVFGNVPAFDTYFRQSLGLCTFCKRGLGVIRGFYESNKEEIDSYNIRTIDYFTGQETNRYYSKAKIIDMVGFIEGEKTTKRRKK